MLRELAGYLDDTVGCCDMTIAAVDRNSIVIEEDFESLENARLASVIPANERC